jgi:hypothetical protein
MIFFQIRKTLQARQLLFVTLFLSLVELSWPKGLAQTDRRLLVAFVFWYTPDHGDFTVTPYWHDPGFRCYAQWMVVCPII